MREFCLIFFFFLIWVPESCHPTVVTTMKSDLYQPLMCVSVYWSVFVLCVFVCVCDIKSEYQQKQCHPCQTFSEFNALLHKTHNAKKQAKETRQQKEQGGQGLGGEQIFEKGHKQYRGGFHEIGGQQPSANSDEYFIEHIQLRLIIIHQAKNQLFIFVINLENINKKSEGLSP